MFQKLAHAEESVHGSSYILHACAAELNLLPVKLTHVCLCEISAMAVKCRRTQIAAAQKPFQRKVPKGELTEGDIQLCAVRSKLCAHTDLSQSIATSLGLVKRTELASLTLNRPFGIQHNVSHGCNKLLQCFCGCWMFPDNTNSGYKSNKINFTMWLLFCYW